MKGLVSIATLIILVLFGILISLRSREPEPVMAPVIIDGNVSGTTIATTTDEEIIDTSTTTATSTATSTDTI